MRKKCNINGPANTGYCPVVGCSFDGIVCATSVCSLRGSLTPGLVISLGLINDSPTCVAGVKMKKKNEKEKK